MEILFPQKRAGVWLRWYVRSGFWVNAGTVLGEYTPAVEVDSPAAWLLKTLNGGFVCKLLISPGDCVKPG